MPEIQKFSPKVMQTQQTLDAWIFQFPSCLLAESLVYKWHNLYMDFWLCRNNFVR